MIVIGKFRFICVNITNLQQIVSVFELYRKLLGDNASVRDRHCPFSFLSVIRFTFECFSDCDIRDFLRLVAFLNILDGVETVLLNISESRKQGCTAGRAGRPKTDAASESKTSLLALPNRKEEKIVRS